MRIADRILKCVTFLGFRKDNKFVPVGTAFLAHIREEENSFQYLVTCQHNVISAGQNSLHVRLNRLLGGSIASDEIPPENWIFHPDSKHRFVDVAVVPIHFPTDMFDHVFLKEADFYTREKINELDVGIGDELFYPGLFHHHSGAARNLPIMRTGILSAMPIEPVETARGPIEAFLMESRSIGGHSGSPVFVNLLAPRNYYSTRPEIVANHPHRDRHYMVLGLLRSYFKAKDESISAVERDDLSLNSGISTVIPSWEILETMKQESQAKIRREANAAFRASKTSEVEASIVRASDNPSHKEDFTSLLNAAARKRPQGGQT
jgi:hypothetical protein